MDVARGEPAGELLRLGALGQARLAERRGARDRRSVAGEHGRQLVGAPRFEADDAETVERPGCHGPAV